MHESDVIVAEDVAVYLGLSRNTVYKMANEGTLPSYKVGRKLRFSKRDVQEYLEGLRGAVKGTEVALAEERVPASTPGITLQEMAARLSGGAVNPLVIASDDILAGTFAHHLTQHGASVVNAPMSSYAGLVSLYTGLADMALVNLYDFRSNSYNLPYVQRLCPGISTIVFRVLRRRQGFIVAAGNPQGITTWSALTHEEVRLASRERGTGSRVLQDQKLLGLEAAFEEVESRTTECATVAEAVSRVVQGAADLCVGFQEEIGPQRGVQFLPMQTECLDLVVRKTERTRAVIRMVKEMMGNQAFATELERIMACDTSTTGAIVYEC